MSNIELPLTTAQSHSKNISYDDFFFNVVNICHKTGATPFSVVQALVLEKINESNFQIYLSGSAFTAIQNNGVSFLLEKVLKVNFGKNQNLIIGTAIHAAIKKVYENIRDEVPLKAKGSIKELVKAINADYVFIKPDLISTYPKNTVIKESIKFFRVFFRNGLDDAEASKILYIEEFMKLPTPVELLSNPANSKKIILTGTPDLIEYDKESKVLTITDFKSSKSPISGKVEKDERLDINLAKIKEVKTALKKLYTQIEKFKDAEMKVLELKNEIAEATAAGKATKRLSDSLVKWEEHLAEYKNNCTQRIGFEQELKFLEEVTLPLEQEYNEEKKIADLIECKNSHADQLNFYALMFALTKGAQYEIHGIRYKIKNIVKSSEPFLQTFEWELHKRESQRAEELYVSCIETLEALLDVKVKPMALFKQSSYSFIGDDSNKFFDEVERELIRLESETAK